MAAQTGLGDAFYVGGFDVSGDIQALGKITCSGKTIDLTGINKSAFERVMGERDGVMDFTTFHNSTGVHARLSTLPTADVISTYVRGAAVGTATASTVAKQANYNLKRGKGGELTFDVSMLGNADGVIWGQSLSAGIRTDGAAANGTAIDSGVVSTAFGLEIFYHLLAFTGTSVIIKLQDSADNSSFADLAGTATSALTTAGQSVWFNITGTVRRYVRAVTVGTFSNAQFVAALTRNETAVVF